MFLIITCTILMVMGFLAASPKQYVLETADGEYCCILQKRNAVYLVAVPVIVSTLRYGFIDTYAYKEMYRLSAGNWSYIFTGAGWGIETGWLFVNYCLNCISSSPKLILFLTALIINAAYMEAAQRYSEDACISFFLFFCLMYLDTNNGMRQMTAAAIVILAFPLLENRKYIPFILCVLAAYQMHNSAIVWLIIAAAVIGRPFNIRTFGALALAIAFLFMPDVITGLISDALSDSQYNYYLDMKGGMRLARALVTGVVPGIFTIVYYIRQKREGYEFEYSESLLINLTIINTMFILMGTYMQYWNRFAFYTFFAPIVLMPKLTRKVFGDEGYYCGIKTIMILLYFAYFSYNIYSNSGAPGAGSDALQKFYIEWWC